MKQRDALLHLAACLDRDGCETCAFIVAKFKLAKCACGNIATKQCDFILVRNGAKIKNNPVNWRTCDAHLCDECATTVSDDLIFWNDGQQPSIERSTTDYCERHANMHRAGVKTEAIFDPVATRADVPSPFILPKD